MQSRGKKQPVGESVGPQIARMGAEWVYETEKSSNGAGGPPQKWPKSGRVEKTLPSGLAVSQPHKRLIYKEFWGVHPSGLEPETF